jgi:hypothetical protein
MCSSRGAARTRLIEVSFHTRKGWSKPHDVRVKAHGLVGAIQLAKRELRKPHVNVTSASVQISKIKGAPFTRTVRGRR